MLDQEAHHQDVDPTQAPDQDAHHGDEPVIALVLLNLIRRNAELFEQLERLAITRAHLAVRVHARDGELALYHGKSSGSGAILGTCRRPAATARAASSGCVPGQGSSRSVESRSFKGPAAGQRVPRRRCARLRAALASRRGADATVSRRAYPIAVVLSVAYLVGASAPCPPPARAADPHDHGAVQLVGPDGWCRAAAVSVTAVCPCGCGDRALVPGGRVGAPIGLAVTSALVVSDSGAGAPHAEISWVPTPPLRAIDHVPLCA